MKKWLKNYLLPHHGNNHHPHFWRKESVALILILVVLIQFVLISNSFLVVNKDRFLASVIPAILISYTNDRRVENSVPVLKENPLLTQAAKLKANDMVARGYFAHNTPEGLLPWHWLRTAGYTYDQAGENLAVNFSDSKDVVEAWMKSPTHRANIVKPVYTEIGIAMAEGYHNGKSAIFVVQFFGTPKAKASAITATSPAVAPTTYIAPNTTATVRATSSVPTKTPTKPLTSKVTTNTGQKAVAGESTSSLPTVNASTSVVSSTTSTNPTASQASNTPITTATTQEDDANVVEKIASSPRNSGMVALSIILALVISALSIILIVNGKFHHPKILMTAISIIVLICALLAWNNGLFGAPTMLNDLNGTSSTMHTEL